MSGEAPVLVLVNGLPGAGKTTLARALGAELGWPVLSKDVIKEALFETLGWSDREQSRRTGSAAMSVLWSVLADIPGEAIVESVFRPSAVHHIHAGLARGPRRRVLQVACRCPAEVALDRFFTRPERGDRHPGHGDHDSSHGRPSVAQWEHAREQDLALHIGPVLSVDTTQPVDVGHVRRWVVDNQIP